MTQLSYILWSYGTLGVRYPQLFDCAITELLSQMNPGNSHELTISSWSFAAVHHYDAMTAVLLDAVAEVLISDVAAFGPKVRSPNSCQPKACLCSRRKYDNLLWRAGCHSLPLTCTVFGLWAHLAPRTSPG